MLTSQSEEPRLLQENGLPKADATQVGGTEPDQIAPPGYVSRTKPDTLSALLVKAQMAVGIALGAVAGPVFAHAVVTQQVASWWVGGICVFTGVVLTVAGLTSSKRRAQRLLVSAKPSDGKQSEGEPEPSGPGVPMLGALLVYKYQVLTEAQLARVLAVQQKRKDQPRLGQLLLEMGLVTKSQLYAALDYQRICQRSRDPRPADSR
jgi:hypothetical protein